MAASVNQDFVTYAGNDVSPIFTVKNAAGVAIDISTVTEIVWICFRAVGETASISKSKTAAQITFVTTGADGKFQVAILAADTVDLSGYFIHQASITDASGNVTTVAVGRMQIGLAPTWSYDSTALSSNQLYRVRRLVGDVLVADQQLQDGEVNYAIELYANDYLAAAECCRYIASQYARKVNIVQAGGGGNLQTNYSDQQKAYTAKAAELEAIAIKNGAGAMPYVGGISVADKASQVADSDRVTPQFNIGMNENLIPLGPGPGNETPGNPAGGNAAAGTDGVTGP